MRALHVLWWCAFAATIVKSIPSNLIIMQQAEDGRLERVEGGIGGGPGPNLPFSLFLSGNVPHLYVFYSPVHQYLSSGLGSELAVDQSRFNPVTRGPPSGDPVEEGAPMSQSEEEAVVSEQVDPPASQNTTPAAMAMETGGGSGNTQPSGGNANSPVVGSSAPSASVMTTSKPEEMMMMTMMTPEASSTVPPPTTTSASMSVPPVHLMSLMATSANGGIPGRPLTAPFPQSHFPQSRFPHQTHSPLTPGFRHAGLPPCQFSFIPHFPYINFPLFQFSPGCRRVHKF